MSMRTPIFAIVLAALVLPLFGLAGPFWATKRVAPVIGNLEYKHVPGLANPLNDAGDIGAALDRLGFEVTRLDNAGYDGLRRGLRAFTRAALTAEVAVVFYAGHGIEIDQRNFLVPVDARLASDRDVEFEAVSLDLVMRAVEPASGLRLMQHADEGAGDIGRRIQYIGERLRCGRLALHRPVQNDVGQYAHDVPSAVCPSNAR